MDVEVRSQPLLALDRANVVRCERAAVKREIRSGSLSVLAALDDDRARGMAVLALLGAQRGWGPRQVASAGQRVPCSAFVSVAELTERQRGRLVALLGGAA